MSDNGEIKDFLFYARFPVPKHISKKNKHIALKTKRGQPYITFDKSVKSAENYMLPQLLSQRNKHKIFEPIGFDVHCMFIFGFDNYYTKEGKRSRFVGDLSNLLELPQDCLTKAGIIKDDSQICSVDGSRRTPDKENFIEIYIYKFKEDTHLDSLELDLHNSD